MAPLRIVAYLSPFLLKMMLFQKKSIIFIEKKRSFPNTIFYQPHLPLLQNQSVTNPQLGKISLECQNLLPWGWQLWDSKEI